MYSRSPEGLDIARELINRGADINLYRKGTTPLHVAARIRNKEMVKLLLEKGANLNIQDEFRRTASDIMKEQQQRIAQRQAVAVTGAHPESTMPNPDVASMVGKFLGGKRKTRKQKRKTGKRKTRK
jgi:ankyrin repeat protein